jgi:hypothetical protein
VLSYVRRHPLWVIVAAGVTVRVVLAFAFVGPPSDITALRAVGEFLQRDFLHAYQLNDHWLGGKIAPAWPYPPAYFPWILAALGIHNVSGLPFHGVVQVAPIAADVAIALAIYTYLGWRGATERLRVAGAALVMLGPSFIAVSGYHGQIDSVAILPGVLALMAWERRPESTRAVGTGLLVGLGAAVKSVPGVLVLALLPAVRSRREAARLIGTAVAVPAIMFLPFFIADPGALEWLGVYGGVGGRGGLSLLLQPSFAFDRLTQGPLEGDDFRAIFRGLAPEPPPLSEFVADNALWIAIVVLALLGAFLMRHRPAPIDGAVLIWLAIYAFVPNFLMQYLIWGLPFFIMAGYLRQTAILQAALLPATVIYYAAASGEGIAEGLATIYVLTMIGVWIFWVAAFATVAARIARRREARPPDVQPPLVKLAGA